MCTVYAHTQKKTKSVAARTNEAAEDFSAFFHGRDTLGGPTDTPKNHSTPNKMLYIETFKKGKNP